MLFLLVACLAVDKVVEESAIPENVREYFVRADEAKAKVVADRQAVLDDLEIALQGGSRELKGVLRQRIKVAKVNLELAKKAKPASELARLPKDGEVGQVGEGKIVAVVDNDTAVLQQRDRYFVLQMDTRGLRTGQDWVSAGAWEVVGLSPDEYKTKRLLDRRLSAATFFVVRPLKAADVDKWRAAYDGEKAADKSKGVKPAEPPLFVPKSKK